MRAYEFMPEGVELAQSTGVDHLATNLLRDYAEGWTTSITASLMDSARSARGNSRYEAAIQEATQAALYLVRNEANEVRMLLRGLALDEEDATAAWHQEQADAPEQLFPPRHEYFSALQPYDPLVLSGVYGLSLAKKQPVRSLLSREGYQVHGFESRIAAARFAGAYILGELSEAEEQYLSDRAPRFSYVEGSRRIEVIVGGTLHGDFMIKRHQVATADIVSPLGAPELFSPVRSEGLIAYHSVEPQILTAMVEHAFRQFGLSGAKWLVDGFIDELQAIATDGQPLGPKVTMFGDFGGNLDDLTGQWLTMRLERAIEEGHELPRKLVATQIAPQARTYFTIHSTEEGLELGYENNGQMDPSQTIPIRIEYFYDFFRALMQQAREGRGRTSLGNHVGLLQHFSEMLSAQ